MSQPNYIKIGSYAYTETENIGKGSFGKVFKGKNLTNSTQIAVKVISIESNKQNMLIKMIKSEVEALKRVRNENIVQFLDFQVINNTAYIITEFCNQKDLRHYLSKHKILPEKKAVEFLKQIVNAFKELCRQQVFHRDLKPANILLDNGVCKIADFGFAKTLDFSVTDYKTQMVSIVGTPLYMSPQLLDKQKYTTKSDIWSLGIIFYEMLFGKVPWVGKDPATYSKNIRSQPLQIDLRINDISPEAEDFLHSCLKVEEEERIGWTELFSHGLVCDDVSSSKSLREDWVGENNEFPSIENKIKAYDKGPVHPSSLIQLYQGKVLIASKAGKSQNELAKVTLNQKLKQLHQISLTQSIVKKMTLGNNGQQSRTCNTSITDEAKITDLVLKSNNDNAINTNRARQNTLIKASQEPSGSPENRANSYISKQSDEILEEFKKIEAPLLVIKNKLVVLNDLYDAVNSSEEFKDVPVIKFNFLITVSKLINMIFKNLSSQVLTKKIKTRSHLLADYLETDSFKRLVAFVEVQKKKYDETLKVCSRKLFELNLSSDKEKDEVLEYYQEVFNEVEEQALLGKIVDMANQMLSQIRFSSQIYKRSVATHTNNQIIDSYGAVPKEYFEGLLALFGEDSILNTFKYDKVDELLLKLEKLKEEAHVRQQ